MESRNCRKNLTQTRSGAWRIIIITSIIIVSITSLRSLFIRYVEVFEQLIETKKQYYFNNRIVTLDIFYHIDFIYTSLQKNMNKSDVIVFNNKFEDGKLLIGIRCVLFLICFCCFRQFCRENTDP